MLYMRLEQYIYCIKIHILYLCCILGVANEFSKTNERPTQAA